MKFIDEVKVTVQAGAGGDGCAAFRREAHVPRGGPAGGDGGRGGDVVFVADAGLTTLLDLRFQRLYRAKAGKPGQGSQKHGRAGESRRVAVPCGTLVYDAETDELIGDLIAHDQELVVAHGGRGGRGNLHFVSPTNRAPREWEPGGPGEERTLRVELKVLAQVGLVGLPNAGKSTFISVVSSARPKVADYPFTTLTPKLGVVGLAGDRSFVMADIPGLISGAHQGVGLGHRFLRHIERTQVLVFLVDDRHAQLGEPGSPLDDLEVLRNELAAYDPALLERPSVVAISKADTIDEARRAEIVAQAAGLAPQIFSAVTREGLDALLEAIWAAMQRLPNN
ncbi:MAG: GTPase ObgE [Deltaproteobacteria bacterium]|nr:GTPase ObgE [Deltaproteobacteria bacterium]